MVAQPPIIKLSWKDKRAFVSVMENAFSLDPLFNKLFIHNQTTLTAAYRVKAFLSFMFEMSMLSGADVRGLFDGDRLVGCYLLEVPVKNPFRRIGGSILVLIRALALPYQISIESFRLVNNYMSITRAESPHRRHYYLSMIGVHETARGQGFGKALMQEIISQVEQDKQAVGIGLDTENSVNVGLYKHFGFALEKEAYLDELAIYCMFRKQ
jgi:ribosomal protein S18 acetylase RimI-like enzyme